MSIPVITTLPGLEQWRQVLNPLNVQTAAPKIPWNFQVTSKQGGNYLTWQQVAGADGYIVDISSTGDFSTGVVSKNLPGNENTAYFDTVPTSGGSAPASMWYRVKATSGTTNQPQSVIGLPTGVIKSNAIAPNDTVTASTTTSDTTTTDGHQINSGGRGIRLNQQ